MKIHTKNIFSHLFPVKVATVGTVSQRGTVKKTKNIHALLLLLKIDNALICGSLPHTNTKSSATDFQCNLSPRSCLFNYPNRSEVTDTYHVARGQRAASRVTKVKTIVGA